MEGDIFDYNNSNTYEFDGDYIKQLKYRILTDRLQSFQHIPYYRFKSFFKKNEKLYVGLEKDQLIPNLPVDFFKKFNDIRSVSSCVLDKDLINFLKRCTDLREFNLIECEISQSFISELSCIGVDTLRKLNFSNKKRQLEKNLDFDGFSNFNNISTIYLSYELSNESVLKFIRSCYRLKKNFLSSLSGYRMR